MRRTERLDAEFTEFVAARSTHLYRSAYLLTTSAATAEDLVQTALTKTYVAWARVRSADDPVAYAHGVLINAFLSERRRRSSTEVPVAEPALVQPAPVSGRQHQTDGNTTERLALMAALQRLAPVDRAVVVLRSAGPQRCRHRAAADPPRLREEPQPACPANAS